MPIPRRRREATRFYKPNDSDDRMNENDEDVVHAGIVSKSQKLPEFRPDVVIRHRQVARDGIEPPPPAFSELFSTISVAFVRVH